MEHAGCILSRCQKGRDGEPFEILHGKKADTRVCDKTNHHRSDPDISSEFALECETTVQSVSAGMQTVRSELAKFGDWNLRTDGTQKQLTT